MRLFILISLSFLGITAFPICVHQRRTLLVQSGGSVTIRCLYTDPYKLDKDLRIIWGETDEDYCSPKEARIILSSENVTEKYKGRLYKKRDPEKNRMEYITITGLKPTDGPRFCCQLYSIRDTWYTGYNKHGTLLQFSDTEYVTHLDELMAVTGEDVILPCYNSKNTSNLTTVTWNHADIETGSCYDSDIVKLNNRDRPGLYSYVNSTEDVSLRIQNIAKVAHSYCCLISTANATLQRTQFSKLIVAVYQPSWDQLTDEISVQENHSVILSCYYRVPKDLISVHQFLWVNVYWRVGNVTGPYAYHPYQEMVHSTYRHRTSIAGMTNLMIKNITKADNTSFHCFVLLKLCASENLFTPEIQYAGGTRVIVTGNFTEPTEPLWTSRNGQETLALAGHVSLKFFFAVIVVALGCV